jgi:hypothetical protein
MCIQYSINGALWQNAPPKTGRGAISRTAVNRLRRKAASFTAERQRREASSRMANPIYL